MHHMLHTEYLEANIKISAWLPCIIGTNVSKCRRSSTLQRLPYFIHYKCQHMSCEMVWRTKTWRDLQMW